MNGLNFLYDKASNVNFSTIPARLQSQGSVVLDKIRDCAVRILSNFRGLSTGQQLGIGFAVVGGGALLLSLIALGRHLLSRREEQRVQRQLDAAPLLQQLDAMREREDRRTAREDAEFAPGVPQPQLQSQADPSPAYPYLPGFNVFIPATVRRHASHVTDSRLNNMGTLVACLRELKYADAQQVLRLDKCNKLETLILIHLLVLAASKNEKLADTVGIRPLLSYVLLVHFKHTNNEADAYNWIFHDPVVQSYFVDILRSTDSHSVFERGLCAHGQPTGEDLANAKAAVEKLRALWPRILDCCRARSHFNEEQMQYLSNISWLQPATGDGDAASFSAPPEVILASEPLLAPEPEAAGPESVVSEPAVAEQKEPRKLTRKERRQAERLAKEEQKVVRLERANEAKAVEQALRGGSASPSPNKLNRRWAVAKQKLIRKI